MALAGAPAAGHGAAAIVAQPPDRTAVSVVVPCFNEQESLPYLANTLRSVVRTLGDRYDFSFIFVDDCSADQTWQTLHAVFGVTPRCTFVRHERNRGVAAAIQTGLRAASTDIVCSMDCDCTYDPHELGRMIPLLAEDVDVVTASPYHPLGRVKNVPRWRLFLSTGLCARSSTPTPAASACIGASRPSASRWSAVDSSGWRRCWVGSIWRGVASWSTRPPWRPACWGGRR
jgi:glycosyltransferase involved in cell wall biosynthesis